MKCQVCDGHVENGTCPNCGPVDNTTRRKTTVSLEDHPNEKELRRLLRSQNRDLAIDHFSSIPNQKEAERSRRDRARARLIHVH